MRLAAASRGVYYHATSGGVQIQCEASTDSPPFSSPQFLPPRPSAELKTEEGLAAVVARWKDDLFRMSVAAGGTGAAGIPSSLHRKYKSLMVIGGFDKADKAFPASVCTGLRLDECSARAIYATCGLKFLSAEASLYGGKSGKGASWHPSRGLHLLRGEALVWQYTLATLDALLEIASDSRAQSPRGRAALATEYMARLKGASVSGASAGLPIPELCGSAPLYCGVPAACHTDFRPHYAKNMTLSELLMRSTLKNHWDYADNVVVNHQPDRSVEQRETRPRYSTAKGPKAGELHFSIRVGAVVRSVLICWGAWSPPTQKHRFGHMEFRLDLDVAASVGANGPLYTPSPRRVIWDGSNKEVLKSATCVSLNNIPPGSHVLGIESKSNASGSVGLTHIVMWP